MNREPVTTSRRVNTDPDIEIRPSAIDGMGVFALRSFQPGDVVLRWDVSHLIRKADTSQLPETERHYTHPFDNDGLVLVQPPERFVNHSCDNNTEVRDFSDVAIRDIHPGEELTSNSRMARAFSLYALAASKTVVER